MRFLLEFFKNVKPVRIQPRSKICLLAESNHRPLVYKTSALTTELRRPRGLSENTRFYYNQLGFRLCLWFRALFKRLNPPELHKSSIFKLMEQKANNPVHRQSLHFSVSHASLSPVLNYSSQMQIQREMSVKSRTQATVLWHIPTRQMMQRVHFDRYKSTPICWPLSRRVN